MVKSADLRITKYTQKFSPTVVSERFTNLKDMAVAEVQVRFSEFAQLEATVKSAIESLVPYPTLIPQYLALARELQAKAHKYGGLVLYNEAQMVKTKWVGRGLVGSVIDVILGVIGISPAIYGYS